MMPRLASSHLPPYIRVYVGLGTQYLSHYTPGMADNLTIITSIYCPHTCNIIIYRPIYTLEYQCIEVLCKDCEISMIVPLHVSVCI